jgi:hypothetical protein
MVSMGRKKAEQVGEPTAEEYLGALKRSGYLMESRLVSALHEMNFFVDPNQCILDKVTGKSREIDIIAEYYDGRVRDICVKTLFIVEAINNIHPLVLMTRREFSPSTDTENYLRYVITPEGAFESHVGLDIYQQKGITNKPIYTQYATFTTKNNNELMACHSDDLYSAFSKMSTYVDYELSKWEDRKSDQYKRIFFFQPLLVLARDLMILKESSNDEYELLPTSVAKFEFNYHKNDVPVTLLIDIITEDHLVNYMNNTMQADEAIFQYASKYPKK